MQNKFPIPRNGASLLLSFRLKSRAVLIVGSGKLAANRAFTCLEADSQVIVLSRGGLESACEEVRFRAEAHEIIWKSVEQEAQHWYTQKASGYYDIDEDEAALESVLSTFPSVSFVCITDTIIPSGGSTRSRASAARLYDIASRKYHIPTNTTDMPTFCDFSFPSTHRFNSIHTGEVTALQVGIVTNSKGCRLSSRIMREIVARLPRSIGDAVDNVGRLRDLAKSDDTRVVNGPAQTEDELPSSPNEPVPQSSLRQLPESSENMLDRTQRRMRWVAQVSEYWPIEYLANLKPTEINGVLDGSITSPLSPAFFGEAQVNMGSAAPTLHTISPLPSPVLTRQGRILLLGSGPGHPSLLTIGTATALKRADLVLSDKLIPEAVLNMIPKHIEVRIARKFPGNADRAQEELSQAAVEAAKQGKVVVRLKQGDPMVYARVSSEISYFTQHGFQPTILPGLSSAFAGPLSAGIPITARGVADSIAICTGVTKGGKPGRIPQYDRATTLLVLMGVARLKELVEVMMAGGYPAYVPTCVVERATMPDQRVVCATLESIMTAMEDPRVGAQRPPGMMVIGWACLGVGEGVEGVAEDEGEGIQERDHERILKWLGGERFRVREGLNENWEDI